MLALLCGPLLWSTNVAAAPTCTIIADAKSGEVLFQEGPCGTPESPASTFKVPLSLMGFDAWVLVDAHTPAKPYRGEYNAMMDSWKVTTDPTIWMEDSVVWFSQEMTKQMGMPLFQKYVDAFAYGNRDLSGDPARNNGLTNSWLGSSLQISPAQQIGFLRRMLAYQLPVSRAAVDQTKTIMPTFPADQNWTVQGKTGSGFRRDGNGAVMRGVQFGWFVGWATQGQRTVVFARLVRDDEKVDDRAGIRARGEFIDALPSLLKP